MASEHRQGWFGLPWFGVKPQEEVVSCVLSGGGSRASFQIGALEYLYRHDPLFTPTVFVGTSAGSILAAGLSQYAKRADQLAWVHRIDDVWSAMTSSDDMFTPRRWFAKLQTDGPSWLDLVTPKPPEPPKAPAKPLLPFLRPETPLPLSPDTPTDPWEWALSPDKELRAEWSLETLSSLMGGLRQLPRIGTDLNAIWHGAERSRSLYQPGPVLKRLLEPETFDPEKVASSGMTLRLAMVALESGELRFMTETGELVDRDNRPIGTKADLLTTGVLASCAIPAVFRPVPIGDEHYVDGGARENLPAELAIGHLGASRNYVVSSQTIGLERGRSMATADLFSIVMRSTEILIDEAGRDELAYAYSAGAVVIHPEISVHSSMTVHPGLIQINRDYGWMRAAERVLGLGAAERERHAAITRHRVECVQWEERYAIDPTPEALAEVGRRKRDLRQLVTGSTTGALPPHADSWWTGFEAHPDPIDAQPFWIPTRHAL
ncbi:patatin-like phospholipase family protein [Tessaracoccus caeni]|uniref:patatin-like phospholipase family protein n=1 Tax=Tessaracoccus caeni TaxID=3031239 RepID=UPI0023DB43EF|nr:patatin-like phospholipase family protein [Tessaracoccus caeni]MDF1487076.1 patatin-like phospholipase family protein [Tessaracoccus caeni]